MAEKTTEKKPTTYEIFLLGSGGWSHVTTIDAHGAAAALRQLTDLADKTETDASGDYMIVPKSNVTYLRPKKKVTSTYEMEEFDLFDTPESFAADEPEPAEEDGA